MRARVCEQQTGTNKLNTMSNRRKLSFPQLNLDAAVWLPQCHDVSLFGLAERRKLNYCYNLLPLSPVALPLESYSSRILSLSFRFRKVDFEGWIVGIKSTLEASERATWRTVIDSFRRTKCETSNGFRKCFLFLKEKDGRILLFF